MIYQYTGNYLTENICCSWWKRPVTLSRTISTEKARKYPLPWNTSNLKLFHRSKVIEILHNSLKIPATCINGTLSAKDLQNSTKKFPRSFWTMLLPNSFNLYFMLCYIVSFQAYYDKHIPVGYVQNTDPKPIILWLLSQRYYQ